MENNGTIQMDDLIDISSDQQKADTKMSLRVKYCALLGGSFVYIHTVDTYVLVLSFYYSAHVNNHFLTLNLLVYVNILGKQKNIC